MNDDKWDYMLLELFHDQNRVDQATWLAELNHGGDQGWEAIGTVLAPRPRGTHHFPHLLLKRRRPSQGGGFASAV